MVRLTQFGLLHRAAWRSLLLAAAACAGPAVAGPETKAADRLGVWIPNAAATLLHEDQSRLDNPILAVVSSAPAWLALWTTTWSGVQPAPPLPQIDFVLISVIVVGLGKRSGLGYSVNIDSVVVHTGGAVLFATEFDPGARCNALSGNAAPVHMVVYPGHPPIVDWQIGTALRDCAP